MTTLLTISIAMVFGAWLACAPAHAAGSSVEACIKAARPATEAQEQCIGKMSSACIGPDETAKSPGVIIECLNAEQEQWDRLLNASYQVMMKGLEPEQQIKLRDMQRSWIESRKKTCDFLYDFFQGSMAYPMIANCMNRETGRRAVFLHGFADDMATWKK